MRTFIIPVVMALLPLLAACGDLLPQQQSALPRCEWCGAAEAPESLSSTAVLANEAEPGERLILRGRVLYADGRTPAAGVLVYAYQTDASGVYQIRGGETGNARRHGRLRGWLRTDVDGRYEIATIRPAPYPSRTEPAHIHITLTPPGGDEMWVNSTIFDDDPLVTGAQRAAGDARGGTGIVRPTRDRFGVLHAERDIAMDADPPRSSAPPNDTFVVDASRSLVRWRGTKFLGLRGHEGTVSLSRGRIIVCGSTVCGGAVVMDMHSIQVTDIPVDQPVPRNRLTGHLKQEAFFWVDRFPTATFRLHGAVPTASGGHRVSGELTMRGVTHPIEFDATARSWTPDELSAVAVVRIDRQNWGVAYRGSRITNDLVDDEIRLELTVIARRVAEEHARSHDVDAGRAVTLASLAASH